MPVTLPAKKKPQVRTERPPFERIALLLQGGGALGAYQAGVYQALAEANLHPDWVAGISIGAINSALIAGNAPERRVEKLREFWETITAPPIASPFFPVAMFAGLPLKNNRLHEAVNQSSVTGTLLLGAPGFFKPRLAPPYLQKPGTDGAISFYDVSPLTATLEKLVDFDRINSEEMRFTVGATNIRTGNFVHFDNTTHKIMPAHIVASGSLPPGFPAAEIDGEHYWDGGLVSNTPLEWVLNSRPRQDTLTFQVDLWSASGDMPRSLTDSDVRQKEIRFSSRTRTATDAFKNTQLLRRATAKLLAAIPEDLKTTPEAQILASEADEKVFNIIQLIYRTRVYEGTSKDFEFSRRSMEEHWASGYADACRTLGYKEVLERPKGLDGVSVFDLAHPDR